mgnify:CR=1 FL=1
MDLITIDVTDIPQQKIFLGQEVEVLGDHCTPQELAGMINTISHEICTLLSNRYKKVYKNDD